MRSSQPATRMDPTEADRSAAPRWKGARRSPGARLVSVYRGAALVLLNTLLLFCLLEGIARLVARQAPGRLPDDLFGPAGRPGATYYHTLPYYREKDWGDEYWREMRALGTAYHPYVVWRRAPFQGRHIAVDEEGVRYTPGTECRAGAYRVFALGGSAMWGYGAPDHATIPAYLQQGLSRRYSRPVCTVNLAEHGFNSTQDLLELQRRLVRGDVPDVAVLLQGSNDLWAAYMSGRPGVHGFLGEIAGKLQRNQDVSVAAQLAARLALVRLLQPQSGPPEPHWTMSDTVLADSVIAVFLQNYRILGALARTYGFAYEVFWQPNIHTSAKPLVAEELAMRDEDLATTVPAWAGLVARAHETLRRRAPRDGHFHDLRGVFDDRKDLMFIDYTHVVPEGNRVLADRMLAELRRR